MSRHAAPRGRRHRRPEPVPPAAPVAARVARPQPWAAAATPVPGRSGPSGGPPAAEARREQVVGAGLAVLLAAVLAGSAGFGRPGVAAGVGLVQAALVPAWVLGTARPGRIGGTVLGLAAAAAADTALLVADRTSPGVLLGVLGLSVPALLVHQLTRGVVRVLVTESVAAVAVACTAAVALSTLVALARAMDGTRLVVAVTLAGGAALAAGRLTDAAAPAPRIAADAPHGLLAVLLATAAGAGAAALAAGGGLDRTEAAVLGALVGAVAALLAVGAGFVAATLPDRPRPAALAYLGVALPLALAAPVGYLVGLAVAG